MMDSSGKCATAPRVRISVLPAEASSAPPREFLPSWALHGLKWVGAFVVPLGALWIGQALSRTPEVEQTAWIAADLPNSARAHWKYGFALHKAERLDQATEDTASRCA